MKRMAAVLVTIAALLATSQQVSEVDPMPMASLIFYAIEVITGYENFPKLPTLPAEDDK
jgi:hypothetical protein